MAGGWRGRSAASWKVSFRGGVGNREQGTPGSRHIIMDKGREAGGERACGQEVWRDEEGNRWDVTMECLGT